MTNDEALAVMKRAAKILYAKNAPPVAIVIPMAHVAGLIGNLQLAFRHPENTGPTRDLMERFVLDLIEKIDPAKGDVYKTLMFGFNGRFDYLLDDVPAGEIFTVLATCPDCGKRGETKTDNPAILYKTERCSGCANKFSGENQ